jgi:hypothetical protein
LPDGGSCVSLCGAVTVDGQGDVAVSSWPNRWFFRADGSGAALVTSGQSEGIVNLSPRLTGFVAITGTPSCYFSRLLGPDASPVPAAPSAALLMVAPNPTRGYVLGAYINATYEDVWVKGLKPTLSLRWVDDSLKPLGDWHPVISWDAGRHHEWRLIVDEHGKALVLSFIYPQTLGGNPPPSTWRFSARWMGAEGPLTDAFEPITPMFKPDSPDRSVLFGNFGDIKQLPHGGFALFEEQAPPGSGGIISPTGWYAAYPSGEARITSAPAWLQPYNGSLYMLADGKGYVATERDPNTCARTIRLIAPSGRTCFALPLEGSSLCQTWQDIPWPDGTLVLETFDEVHWWPGLARPAR